MSDLTVLNGPDDLDKRPPVRRDHYFTSSYDLGNVYLGYNGLEFTTISGPVDSVLTIPTKSIDDILEECKDETLDDNAPDDRRCVVCMDRKRIVAPQCGHLVLCATCTKELHPKKCPTCRVDITGVQRIFL